MTKRLSPERLAVLTACLDAVFAQCTPERLREARQAKGWSQHQLALKLGLERNTIGRMERGTDPIDRRTWFSFLYLLDETPCGASPCQFHSPTN